MPHVRLTYCAALAATSVVALAPLSANSAYLHDELVVRGLDAPTSFAFLGRRIVVAEKGGIVRLYAGGRLLRAPFIDLRSRVNADGDRGLLSIAVGHRSSQQLVYLYYAAERSGAHGARSRTMRLVSFEIGANRALRATERVVLGKDDGGDCNQSRRGSDCIPADCRCHTGGEIALAPDGSVFLSTGDATSAGAAYPNALRAQDLDSLAGKILHVSPAGAGLRSNPFWNGDAHANRSKIWAYGLRNAFRFALVPGGGAFVGDVGWHLFEEIDHAVGGENFGWPCYEGNVKTPGYNSMTLCRQLYSQHGRTRFPIFKYPRLARGSAVILGPYDRGMLYFADYVGGTLRSLKIRNGNVANSTRVIMHTAGSPVDLHIGPGGWLYYLTFDTGELRRVRLH